MYETVRIVGKLRPKYVIWENVKNVLSQKHRHNFDNYLNAMASLGYKNYYQVLNAKDYGIPQNRERVFTISIRNDINKEFNFPPKQELHLRLKDLLEDDVDEKFFLTEKQIESIKNSTFTVNSRRIQEKDYCDTICARDWKDPKCIQVGNADLKGYEQMKRVYSDEGISPTLSAMQGGYRQPLVEEPKIIKHDIVQQVRIRKYPIDTDKLVQVLRNAKLEKDITNSIIASELDVPVTKVEHWFRRDNCFAIPDEDIWFKLKELLGITTNEFDKAIMTFEIKDGVYDKANRVYEENGLAPTLTQQEEKVMNNYRIRKLTPRECWRLMGFTDSEFDKASVGISNTQLYKMAGNSIVVNVLVEIFKNLFEV